MRILHLLSSNVYAGAENVACGITKMFKPEIEMAYSSLNGPIIESLKERSIKFLPFSELTKTEVWRIVNEYKPDIIHAHDVRASIQAVRGGGGIEVISHLHCNFDEMKRISVKAVAYLSYAKKFKRIIAVSDDALNSYVFAKYIKHKSTVLYNVIDPEDLSIKVLSDPTEYNYDGVFIGRLVDQKNPLRIVKIMTMACRELPDAKFAIIGDGPLREQTQQAICAAGMDNQIRMLGYMSNPYKVLSQTKAMLMCSKYEGTPMTVIEAMLLGVPVVSTPTDGICKIIQSGKNGYLNDNNKVLVASLYNLIKQKDTYKHFSEMAKTRIATLNNIDNYKKVLKGLYMEEPCKKL